MFESQQFIKSAFSLKDLIKSNLPEVILCGRSNVGKSSFINSLFNRKDLAKISSTPGKTRSINYYLIDNKFYIVDLPGFGYAKTSKKEREYWAKLVGDYIKTSKSIILAVHFLDGRVHPTDLDKQLNNYLNQSVIPYIVLLSKADKLNQSQMANSKKNISAFFPELKINENFIAYSSKTKKGKKEIVNMFSELLY